MTITITTTTSVTFDPADVPPAGSDSNQLNRIERAIQLMSAETKAVLADIDAETTRIAEAIEELAANSSDTELKGALQTHLARLKGIAANPEQPIPVEA